MSDWQIEQQMTEIEQLKQQLVEVTGERDACERRIDSWREECAAARRAVWEEAAIYWDNAAEGPCKDGDDFAWACRVAQWCREQANPQLDGRS